jgi:hypothetical protein
MMNYRTGCPTTGTICSRNGDGADYLVAHLVHFVGFTGGPGTCCLAVKNSRSDALRFWNAEINGPETAIDSARFDRTRAVAIQQPLVASQDTREY